MIKNQFSERLKLILYRYIFTNLKSLKFYKYLDKCYVYYKYILFF